MFIQREIKKTALSVLKKYPVLTVTGPRQSGKTTFVKHMFPDFHYESLEDPDVREIALSDPRMFLKKANKKNMILDEIQRAPELISYIQSVVDDSEKLGMFILTGSHQFDLIQNISQSLAGRTAILKLLPFSISELSQMKLTESLNQHIQEGFYPGVHDRKIDPVIAYKNYFETYIERDLRQVIQIQNLRLFRKFVKLCAGRIGQLFSASSLANETGVSVPTINSWISILETSFIIMLLEPYYTNTKKRLIKTPKLYFYDTGLASYLLGIENQLHLSRDPLRGSLFENLVIMELVKKRYNMGLDHNLFFYRDSNMNEVDILVKSGDKFKAIEVKSAETFHKSFLKGLSYIKKIFPQNVEASYVVYSGEKELKGKEFNLVNYKDLSNQV